MPRDFFDPTPDKQVVVLVESATLRKTIAVLGPRQNRFLSNT
jgi:hypothetical protein